MSVITESDGSEDVNDFLMRIRELGDRRDKEDEERARKLEEDIILGRKERQARRAERARSLSPTKSASNAGTPHSLRSPLDSTMQEDIPKSPMDAQQAATSRISTAANNYPTSDTPSTVEPKVEPQDDSESQHNLSQLQHKTTGLSNILPSAATTPSRVGTPSWQQRPSSRGSSGTRVRPLSMVATENYAARSPRTTPDPSTTKEDIVSRHQITQSLESKNPSWFRQTEDRGAGSAAYRRNQDENQTDVAFAMEKMRLPGLSRESSVEPEKELGPPPESVRSVSQVTEGTARGNSDWDQKYPNSASMSSVSGVRSPLPTLRSQKFEPPLSDTSFTYLSEPSPPVRALAMSPSQGRISPERMERPSSPTKGLGGFVQSAMLKRSDSVNKRWSAQAGPGLSRGNSIVSNRSGYDGPRQTKGGVSPSKDSRPNSQSRDNSPHQSSRPTSSHSQSTFTGFRAENEEFSTSTSTIGAKQDSGDVEFAKPALPYLKNTGSTHKNPKGAIEEVNSNQAPPSPGKKWSPTKASWLESAIQKPDSPKPKAPAPQQPSWMANISKARQERASIDLGKSAGHKEVSTEGLIRSPPPGPFKKPQTFGGDHKYLGLSGASSSKIQSSNGTAPLNGPAGKAKAEVGTFGEITTPVDETSIEKMLSTPNSPALSTSGSFGPKSQTLLGSPSSIKSKPETPPKRDFRSNLKPRRTSVGKDSKEEVEFKNVFGKLKRAQTQNYVAPDELKDNILRGKAGLATTGGPKKTERKDEFKESLLKQKEAIKAGPPSVPRKPSSGSSTISQDLTIPEAIAKRNGLNRSENSLNNISASRFETEKFPKSPEGLSELNKSRENSEPELSGQQPSTLQKIPAIKGKLGDRFNSSLAGLLSRGPSPVARDTKPMDPDALAGNTLVPNIMEEPPTNGTKLNHMTKARARGPKRRLPAVGNFDLSTEDSNSGSKPTANEEQQSSVPQEPNTRSKFPSIPGSASKLDTRTLASISNNGRKSSQPLSPRKPSTNVSLIEETKSISPTSKPSTRITSPSVARTSPSTRPKPSTEVIGEQSRKIESSSNHGLSRSPEKLLHVGEPLSGVFSTQQRPQQTSQEIIQPYDYTKDKAKAGDILPASGLKDSEKVTSPVKLVSHKHEEITSEKSSLFSTKPRKEPVGLGIQSTSQESQRPASLDHNLPSPPIRSPAFPNSPGSPPLPGKKPSLIANRVLSRTNLNQPKSRPSELPDSPNSGVSYLLASVFGDVQRSNTKINIDTQSVLASRAPNDGFDKVKTLRKQIWELTGHGKSIPVPSHQEHILFEESLYICTHVFGTPSGTRTTEIYLWVGSSVAQSAAEDAQLFARKVAKENNGKLLILHQGKESSNFFQSLGGIVITRRGSSARGDSPSKATATYMLCGRRHVGQIAFDEVDFNVKSLCKGFPFIVSARFGKLYLWKGSGSGADELGCARLIGMDLGLTGEIEEIDEGQEPATFWESLPGGSRDFSVAGDVQHWHLKPSCEKYGTRLFSIDAEAPRPKSSSGFNMWGRRGSAPPEENGGVVSRIREIVPFILTDVLSEGIYVLDSFFEVFVIIPDTTFSSLPRPSLSLTSQPNLLTRLRASLLFAQEYAILSASLEDRPFVPACRLVFLPALTLDPNPKPVPEGLRSAFRKWDREALRKRDGDACTVLGVGETLGALGVVRD